MRQVLRRHLEDTRSKTNDRARAKPLDTTPKVITLRHLSYKKKSHRSHTGSRKRARIPEIEVECEEQELRELLALERPKRRKDLREVLCFKCNNLGHYANNCPEKKSNGKGGNGNRNRVNWDEKPKRDLSQVTCYKCNNKGHYADKCPTRLHRVNPPNTT
jgi:hypothetical protein